MTAEDRAALGIVYCSKCKQDTIPHAFTGRCLFCDKKLVKKQAAVRPPLHHPPND